MGWLIGFVVLLAFALRIDIRVGLHSNSRVHEVVWDVPTFVSRIFAKKIQK